MKNNFHRRQWQVTEYPFRASDLPHTETIFTIGNGLIGTRGSFEEGYPDDTPTTLVAGIFNKKDEESVPELVNMPNWLFFTIEINGNIFSINQGKVLGFERILDMKRGILHRNVLWMSPKGDVLRLCFERFASLDNPHVFVCRVMIQVLSEGEHRVTITSALDNSVTNPMDVDHWIRVTGYSENDKLWFRGLTDQSKYDVAMASRLVVDRKDTIWHDQSRDKFIAHYTSFSMGYREKVTVTKYVSLHTSRNTDDTLKSCRQSLNDALASGYDELKANHIRAWADYWEHMDIVIEGDEVAQQAIRFCTYHVLIALPRHEERVSIAAKSLSGFGYKGHVFWDAELFMIPPLSLSYPSAAKRLFMYRYHNLQGARNKAQLADYAGAMFPWESTDTGEETTPQWANDADASGMKARIWTGDNEQHISSDITYGVLQYWEWTGDDEWFAHYGAEIVLDTAKFWGSRAEYDPENDRYELRMQIGPDEYHENIDNSFFTNRLVIWHLQWAIGVWKWLESIYPDDAQRLKTQLDIQAEHLERWRDIAQKMYLPSKDGIFEQFEGFFDKLQAHDIEDYTPRTTNLDWIIGREKTQSLQVIKQADVVMIMALLGEELGDTDLLRRNWDFYSTIVDHGSSLSPSIHAWVAARLGLIDIAYDLFIYSATIDLNDHRGNVRDGIHAASCGGVWQAVVLGFCGLQITANGLITDPHLPEHWREVRFKVQYRGKPTEIVIKNTR